MARGRNPSRLSGAEAGSVAEPEPEPEPGGDGSRR